MTRGLSRRRILQSSSAWLSALPLFGYRGEADAAEATGRLQSFVGIYMPHGVARELYRPGPTFDLRTTATSLSPFDDEATLGKSLREELLVVEGLDLTAGLAGGSTGHDASRVLLTGSAGTGKNASLDQYLAVDRGLGAATPLASLVLGVGNARPELGQCVSYAAGGRALPKIIDPVETFHQAFGQWFAGNDPAVARRLQSERRQKKSMIDALTADLAGLSARVGALDRGKLDQHLTSLREVEKSLTTFELTCVEPAAPDRAVVAKVLAHGGGEPYFDAITNLQVDLLAEAIHCGVTRFATIFLADLSGTHLDPSLPNDIHIDVAHRYAASIDGQAGTGQPSTWRALAAQNRYAFAKVARLAAKLSAYGRLDTTLLLASSDMGDPARHSSRNVPTVLLGGGSTFRMGRYVDVRVAGQGIPNNRLLVSIARAFGVETDAFGEAEDPTIVRGELPELRG